MNILGIKLTHDAAVTMIRNGKVSFHVELEKINNGARYTRMRRESEIHDILASFGYALEDIDYISIDGWEHGRIEEWDLEVNGYNEITSPGEFDGRGGVNFLGRRCGTFKHVYNHITSAICTSNFPKGTREVHVLVWDGGTAPRLYFYDGHRVKPLASGPSFFKPLASGPSFYGYIYSIMGYYFGPYKDESKRYDPNQRNFGQYDYPGKLMSYMSTGRCSDYMSMVLTQIYNQVLSAHDLYPDDDLKPLNGILEHAFCAAVAERFPDDDHADILTGIHNLLGRLLLDFCAKHVPQNGPLCFVGGSALNIKWNAALASRYDLWVPPMPNDAGSSFGAACSEYMAVTGFAKVEWDVYSGPTFRNERAMRKGWAISECGPKEMAKFLAANPTTPVISVIGRAEIGPRALGHRSILCSAAYDENRRMLNKIKGRESFRPVAPICREESAAKLFSPGTPDPYMLYSHQVVDRYVRVIPAVVHSDGSARLQTVSKTDCPTLHSLLTEYERLTGVGVLCNTSANFNGTGFFPDFESAAALPGIDHIWDGEILHTRTEAEGQLL